MNTFKFLPLAMLIALSGCATVKMENKIITNEKHSKHTVHVIKNTNTAIVGIPLTEDKKLPKSLEKLKIKVKTGQKVVFAGPEKFEIFAKNNNFAIFKAYTQTQSCDKQSQECLASKDGVINLNIPKPKDISDPAIAKQLREQKKIIVPFGIRIDGDEIDPEMEISEEE
jgi:hypothetical protein